MCNLHPAKMVSPGAAEKGGKSTVLCISLRKRARKIVWGLGGRGGNKMVLSDSLMRGAKSCSARRRGGKHFFLLSPRRTRGRGGREEKNAARKKRGKVGQGFPLSLPPLLSPRGDKNRLVPGADGSEKKGEGKKGGKGVASTFDVSPPAGRDSNS